MSRTYANPESSNRKYLPSQLKIICDYYELTPLNSNKVTRTKLLDLLLKHNVRLYRYIGYEKKKLQRAVLHLIVSADVNSDDWSIWCAFREMIKGKWESINEEIDGTAFELRNDYDLCDIDISFSDLQLVFDEEKFWALVESMDSMSSTDYESYSQQ